MGAQRVVLGAVLLWSGTAGSLVAGSEDEGAWQGVGGWQDEGDGAPEPESGPDGPDPKCQPAFLEEEAIAAQDEAEAMATKDLGLGLLTLSSPPSPPCQTFLNKTSCPERCFWYPHKKVCRTYAAPQPPCGCPQYQICKPKAGKSPSKINCIPPYNTCPERCVWNREQRRCSLVKLPPPPGEIDTSNKGVLTLTGIFLLILMGIGVVIGFMIKWIEKQEVAARMASLPRPLDPNGDLIAPLTEDGIDEGGEREYRREGGEYAKGLEREYRKAGE